MTKRDFGLSVRTDLAQLNAVAVGDEAAYIGDRLNRRVIRVKLGYAATETAGAP